MRVYPSDVPSTITRVLMDAAVRFGAQHVEEFDVLSWPETWGSTALGFGGMGGQAMTVAQTVVLLNGNYAHFYWGGRFAMTRSRKDAYEAMKSCRSPKMVR